MIRALTKVTSQGQVSVPASIRRALGLTPGAVIEWTEESGGRFVVARAARHSSQDVHAALFPEGKAPAQPLDALKQGIAAHMRRRHARP